MSFFDSLEKVREKPDHVKRGVALGIAIVITLGIIILWLSLDEMPKENFSGLKERANDPMDIIKGALK